MTMKILLKGPVLTCSGYGEQARFALRALNSRPDLFDVFVQPITWGNTSWLSGVDSDRDVTDVLIEKTIAHLQQGGRFDASVQVTVPNEFSTDMAPVNIGYTAGIETTQVAPEWIVKANEMNSLIVVSNHSKNVFENTRYVNSQNNNAPQLKLEKPIKAVNYPVKTFDNIDLSAQGLKLDYDFNFITIAQMGPRKNVPHLIKWFLDEFHGDEVGLIIKTNGGKNNQSDFEGLSADLGSTIRKYDQQTPDRKCKLYLLHGDMSDAEIHSLYTHSQVSAYVTLTHGEGFGLPIFEAAYSDLPVVAPGWSGQLDFLLDENNKKQFYDVDYDLNTIPDNAVWNGVLHKESKWAYPREHSAKNQMRACYKDLTGPLKEETLKKAADFGEYLRTTRTPEIMYEKFIDALGLDTEIEWAQQLSQIEIL